LRIFEENQNPVSSNCCFTGSAMFFDWILAIYLTAIPSILRSTGSMLPSTSIASLHNSIHITREIKGLANISRTKLLIIYNSLVRTIIEYGCPVWQITPRENMKKLEAIQVLDYI
jgi:hypothetical protein